MILKGLKETGASHLAPGLRGRARAGGKIVFGWFLSKLLCIAIFTLARVISVLELVEMRRWRVRHGFWISTSQWLFPVTYCFWNISKWQHHKYHYCFIVICIVIYAAIVINVAVVFVIVIGVIKIMIILTILIIITELILQKKLSVKRFFVWKRHHATTLCLRNLIADDTNPGMAGEKTGTTWTEVSERVVCERT